MTQTGVLYVGWPSGDGGGIRLLAVHESAGRGCRLRTHVSSASFLMRTKSTIHKDTAHTHRTGSLYSISRHRCALASLEIARAIVAANSRGKGVAAVDVEPLTARCPSGP